MFSDEIEEEHYDILLTRLETILGKCRRRGIALAEQKLLKYSLMKPIVLGSCKYPFFSKMSIY